MSIVIDLADYRDVTPREDEIRLPEDGFVLRALHLIDLGGLVEAHKWLSLAALRGSARARNEVAAAQKALDLYIRSTMRVAV